MIKFILTIFILIMPFKFHASSQLKQPSFQAIIFDFGGVMADFDLKNLLSFIAKEFDMTVDELKSAVKKEIDYLAIGQLKEEDFWEQFAIKYNISLPNNWNLKYKKFIKNNVKAKREMYNLVVKLKKHGFQISLLSDITEWQASAVKELDLYKEFNPIALSYEIKARKPNKQSYYAILNKLKLEPNECLFIDDKIENVTQAKKLGINSLHFKSYKELIKDLKELNVSL